MRTLQSQTRLIDRYLRPSPVSIAHGILVHLKASRWLPRSCPFYQVMIYISCIDAYFILYLHNIYIYKHHQTPLYVYTIHQHLLFWSSSNPVTRELLVVSSLFVVLEVQCLLGRVWKQRSGPEHHGKDEYGTLPQWVRNLWLYIYI